MIELLDAMIKTEFALSFYKMQFCHSINVKSAA